MRIAKNPSVMQIDRQLGKRGNESAEEAAKYT